MAEPDFVNEDSLFYEMSTESQSTQTDRISENDTKLIAQHLNYHGQMISMCEELLAEGTRSGKDGLALVLRMKWLKKPAVSLKTLVQNSKHSSPEETHKYLHSKVLPGLLPWVASISLNEACANTWEEVSARIKTVKNSVDKCRSIQLQAYVKLGKLLEEGARLYYEGLTAQQEVATFESWSRKNVGMSARQCQRIRAIAKVLYPYPALLNLTLTEEDRRLTEIQTMLLVTKYKDFWSREL